MIFIFLRHRQLKTSSFYVEPEEISSGYKWKRVIDKTTGVFTSKTVQSIFQYVRITNVSIITEKKLKNSENKCGSLFDEYNRKQNLSQSSIQFLAEIVFKFIEEKYSTENRKDVENVCTSLQTLFPELQKVYLVRLF